MDNLIKPAFQTRPYKPSEVIRIPDRWQSYQYMKHGATPVDIYIDFAKDNLVMVFLKSETKELYEKWRRYELS